MKLVIISDLHFDEENDWEKIEKISNYLIVRVKMKLKESEQIAFIVLGDIINRGGEGNNAVKFAEASKFFDKIKNEINNVQFYFIPGNHEIKDNDIISEFHSFATQHKPSYEHFSLEQSVFSEILEGVNLILTDSTLGRKHDVNGKIDVEILKKHMQLNYKNLIFMHHPPCEQDGADRPLENSAELIATHANFVFYGHQHGYVKVPDFLQNDTDIHSVGSLFKTEKGAKSEFLLLDVTNGIINYARRYDYVSEYYNSQLMFPKKVNLQSQDLKLDIPKLINGFVNRKYKIISSDNSNNTIFSTSERLGGIDESILIQKRDFILLLGDAGIGKTYSLIHMYYSMIENQDYIPIWLSLRNANYEIIKEHLSYAQYNTIDNKTPMLFIDGLDEMKSEYTSAFMRDIGSAISGDAEVKIIVSMRANYQISIDKFEKYLLMSLTQNEIEQIAKGNSIDNVEDFINQITVNNCINLSQNPFYLFEMIKIYKKNNSLPRRADLFKYMLKIRFQDGDERDKCDYSKSLLGNEFVLINKLKILSFFMSTVQEYLLENYKYTQILDPDIRVQFQKIGLITKTEKYPEVFWGFEHRNFSEYLTADLLSNVNFVDLIHVITYDTNHKKIRPSWVNIIGFILDLRKKTDLKEWLIKNAVNELCELQPDSLTEDDRNVVFIAVFKDCTEKNVPLYTKYYADKLVKYFQSIQIVDYLIECLKENRNNYDVLSSFYFLQYCTEFYGKEDIILNTIKEKYISSNVSENIVIRAVKVVITISSVYKTKSIGEIISIIKSDIRGEIIGVTCGLIAKTYTSDEYSDYLLEKLENANKIQESYSAQKNLVEAVGIFNNTDNILMAIRVLIDHKGYNRLFHKDGLFSTLLEKLCSSYEVMEIDVTKELLQIFITCSHECKQFEINAIKECFRHLGVTETAFEMLISYKLNDWDMLFSIESIMEDELIAKFLECYNNDKLNTNMVKWYARRLNEESPIYLAVNEAVMKKEGSPIERESKVDWEKLSREGTQKYFDSLFNKDEFENLLDEVIEYYEADILCGNLLNESFNCIPADRKDLNCVVTALLHCGMDKTRLVKFIYEIDWDLFSMYQIIHTLKQNKDIEVKDEQKIIIENYYLKMILSTDFEENPLSEFIVNIAEQMVFLINRFSFEISDEKLLEFLHLPWYVFEDSSASSESKALKYVEQKIKNKQKLHEKIILNLQKENLNPYAIQAHIFYCLENKLTNAVDLSTKFLKDKDKEGSFLQNCAIDYLIAIKGEWYVDSLVEENMDEHLLRYLSIKLETEHQKLISVLIQKNQESENKLIYLEELVNLNSEYALYTYLKLIKESNGIPDKHSDSARIPEITHAISNIKDIKLLDCVGELFSLSMNEGFEDKEAFGLFSSTSTAIQNLIQVDAYNVKKKLKGLVERNSENIKLKSQCNYYLNSIEKQLEISSDTPWDMKTTLEFVKKISDNSITI